jgi:UDP-N-acetylglucosamine:LPS N-acetylglucosamine transferase
MSTRRSILFAGGGTGGHIFPALAIAECLRDSDPHIDIQFLCSTRPGDTEMLSAERLGDVPAAFATVPAHPFAFGPRGLLRFVSTWGSAVRSVRMQIATARLRTPHVTVVAMGGFVAAPATQAARADRCPVVMVNLDATPGRANRWIAGHARRIFTAADTGPAGWLRVPPIVRRAARAPGPPEMCRRILGLVPDRPTLLVTGASLGAQSINRFLEAFVGEHAHFLRETGWQVVHQTGKSDIDELRSAYKSARVPSVVEPFFREMGVAWGSADLAISRAGAGSVAEAWCNRVPCIFLPYPFHADHHQKLNARPLVGAGAAILADDLIEPRENARTIGPMVAGLLRDAGARDEMRRGAESLGPADGAWRVAQALLTDA